MIELYLAENFSDAHMLKGMLEEVGILCEVRGGKEQVVVATPLSADVFPTIYLFDESQMEAASEVVRLFESRKNSLPEDTSPWVCASCGEQCDGMFAECWKCCTCREEE